MCARLKVSLDDEHAGADDGVPATNLAISNSSSPGIVSSDI